MSEADILVVNKYDWTHPERGGAETHLKEVLSRLSDRGYEIDVLCTRYPGAPEVETLDGVCIRRKGLNKASPILSHIVLTLYAIIWANFQKYDLVVDSFSPLPWFIPTGKPRVTVVHIINRKESFNNQPFPVDIIAFSVETIGLIRGSGRKTISVSNSVTEVLEKFGYDEVFEIHSGVDVEKYEFNRCSTKPVVSFLGRLEHRKGGDMIPEIAEELKSDLGEGCKLHVMGPPGEYTDAVRRIRDSSIEYHGFVSEEKKVELLNESRCLVVPSRQESWGLAVLEANSCGTPAVGFKVAGLVNSIQNEKTGYLVPPNDIPEMAKKVSLIAEDDEKYGEVSQHARKWAESHSWDNCVNQIDSVLAECI